MIEDILCGLGMLVFFGGLAFLMFGLPLLLEHKQRMAKIERGIDPDAYDKEPDTYDEED